jgi:BASS family bile acid:Na+ symporter
MAVMQSARTAALPVAMVLGILFHNFFDRFGFLLPYLIFCMLFINFSNISIKKLKIGRLHIILLAFQLVAASVVYLVLRQFNIVVAEGLMICVFAPTAMSSVVIAGMLGANVTTMATLCMVTNVGVALAAPIMFATVGTLPAQGFFQSVVAILLKVGPVVIFPLAASWLVQWLRPKWNEAIRRSQIISFWLWAIALTVVMGRTVNFILMQPAGNYTIEIILAAGALTVCLSQFAIGRWFGRRSGDSIAGGQALGQKNTVLAIWMAQTYLDPLSSVAPATYVVWHNVVNSWQLWRNKKSNLRI